MSDARSCRECAVRRLTPEMLRDDTVRGFRARMKRLIGRGDLMRQRGLCIWCADRYRALGRS